MRKITKEMANAFNNDLPFNKDNTKVFGIPAQKFIF